MVRIIIAGGRDFSDYELLKKSVHDIIYDLVYDGRCTCYTCEIVSGTARGADQLGERLAAEDGFSLKRFPADWNTYGKRAGYLRNEQMAKYAVSDGHYGVLVAFWDGVSRGTKHMIDLANKHGLEVHVINY